MPGILIPNWQVLIGESLSDTCAIIAGVRDLWLSRDIIKCVHQLWSSAKQALDVFAIELCYGAAAHQSE